MLGHMAIENTTLPFKKSLKAQIAKIVLKRIKEDGLILPDNQDIVERLE